ncbi:HD domain-containing protein [Serpentinicella alkaliphila]|uniref:Putative nucleotidyltransferase with HDIG domain n=1 Tax=Serpentinicella alkaliphila TaxID=1734049 RepID=A0A4R2T9I3_9FIRM|nr:HD domain-containing protein [Serpentinicella alkaliphila]QUH25778.1 HDIG domain-containing protein [Serpentinicella alkaliphila]TCP99777.1 putative nucleotidyltransferase with HDIG domain [Serpentinicella alkaliphila]
MIYRIRQFINGINAKIYNEDKIFIEKYLNNKEQELFYKLRLSEQRHSLNVAYGCNKEMSANSTLIKAALLHDIGKISSNLSIINKSLVVISIALKIKDSYLPIFLRQALNYKLNHGHLGYELLKNLVSDEKMLMLIKHHHYPDDYMIPEMQVLIKYDDLN